MEDSPFKKVIKMVKDMIHKLMLEAQEEAEHKGLCYKAMENHQCEVEQLVAMLDGALAYLTKQQLFPR